MSVSTHNFRTLPPQNFAPLTQWCWCWQETKKYKVVTASWSKMFTHFHENASTGSKLYWISGGGGNTWTWRKDKMAAAEWIVTHSVDLAQWVRCVLHKQCYVPTGCVLLMTCTWPWQNYPVTSRYLAAQRQPRPHQTGGEQLKTLDDKDGQNETNCVQQQPWTWTNW